MFVIIGQRAGSFQYFFAVCSEQLAHNGAVIRPAAWWNWNIPVELDVVLELTYRKFNRLILNAAMVGQKIAVGFAHTGFMQ